VRKDTYARDDHGAALAQYKRILIAALKILEKDSPVKTPLKYFSPNKASGLRQY
jgi:hypothetical protein